MPASKSLRVLYEDNHLLVVNKPAGLLVQGDITGDESLVEQSKTYIKEKHDKPGAVFMGLVHRIDRPVSGVVLLARTSKALTRMTKQFKDRETKKTYWAIVTSRPANPSGTLVHWLEKNEKRNFTIAYSFEKPGSLRSELSYRIIGNVNGYWLLEVIPITGRSHQIRVQLSQMGCPIYGDLKYGDTNTTEDASICLHARKLEFIHPVKNELMAVEASVPELAVWKHFDT